MEPIYTLDNLNLLLSNVVADTFGVYGHELTNGLKIFFYNRTPPLSIEPELTSPQLIYLFFSLVVMYALLSHTKHSGPNAKQRRGQE